MGVAEALITFKMFFVVQVKTCRTTDQEEKCGVRHCWVTVNQHEQHRPNAFLLCCTFSMILWSIPWLFCDLCNIARKSNPKLHESFSKWFNSLLSCFTQWKQRAAGESAFSNSNKLPLMLNTGISFTFVM